MLESDNTQQQADLFRQFCEGMPPLDARLEPWMRAVCQSGSIHEWVASHGSPLNLIDPRPLQRNISELKQVANSRNLDFRVFFARKANKCLSLVDAARGIGAGIDTASLAELQQVLARSVEPQRVINTAAVKSRQFLQVCIDSQVTIAIDNVDELRHAQELCDVSGKNASIALRISGFTHDGAKLESRFGFDVDRCLAVVREHWSHPEASRLSIEGIHFHLDGYDAGERVSAIWQSLDVIDQLRQIGHTPQFVDMGGGFPMSYLRSADQWDAFRRAHRRGLLGLGEPVTYKNDGLGHLVVNGAIHGTMNCYPYYQRPVRASWLAGILDSRREGETIAEAFRRRRLQLRCEPGRSVLDGCGMTVACVEFRKQHRDGHWMIGLSMNGTQCKTGSADFLVDPLLIPVRAHRQAELMEGYLVGAYCTEAELLTLRRLRFPIGVEVGDLVAFPNTAGYLMHFLESRSHQFPLATNVTVKYDLSSVTVDPIDQPGGEHVAAVPGESRT